MKIFLFLIFQTTKVVGLVTIRAKSTNTITALRKNIWKYYGGSVF